MPLKDDEKRRAYQRKWYREHADRVKEWTRKRKYETYAGVCSNCGGPTVGVNGPGSAPEWCGKSECRSAQWAAKRATRDGRT